MVMSTYLFIYVRECSIFMIHGKKIELDVNLIVIGFLIIISLINVP